MAVQTDATGTVAQGAAAPQEQAEEQAQQLDVGADGAQQEGEEKSPAEEQAEEIFAYEFEDVDDQGQKHKVAEELPKSKVKEILARRKRLDTEAYKRLAHFNRVKAELLDPIDRLAEEAKQDPLKGLELLRRLGVDPEAAALAYASRALEEEKLTPEQRRLRQLEQEKADLERKLNATGEERRKQEAAAERQAAMQEAEKGIADALTAANLPKHPMALSLISAFAAAQVRAGRSVDYDVAAEDVTDFVKEYSRAWLDSLGYEALVKELPPEVLKKIREGDVARAVSGPRTGHRPPAPRPHGSKERKFMSPEEWRAQLLNGR